MSQTHCECCQLPIPDCRVMAEIRELRQPGGPEAFMVRYGNQLRAKASREQSEVQRAAERKSRLERCGVPGRVAGPASYPTTNEAVNAARRFSQDRSASFLYLAGPTGCGKSVAGAVAMVRGVDAWKWNEMATGTKALPSMFVHARELTTVLDYDADFRNRREEWARIGLLVLDDVGHEGTDRGRSELASLCMWRHDNGKRTVLTTNLGPGDFKARYGAALADRINSAAVAPNLAIVKSMRQRSDVRRAP